LLLNLHLWLRWFLRPHCALHVQPALLLLQPRRLQLLRQLYSI
jgi:hypothetical protein